MPRRSRASQSSTSSSPLGVVLKASPSRLALGAADSQLILTLTSRVDHELVDLAIEWDLPADVMGQALPSVPLAAPPASPVTTRSRSSSARPLDERRSFKASNRQGSMGGRLLPLTPVFHIARLAPQGVFEAAFALRPTASGRHALKIRRIVYQDAQGQQGVYIPDGVAHLVVDEPTPPHLELTARCLRDAALGEPLPVELRLENRGTLPARSVHLAFDLPADVRLAPPADALPGEGTERLSRVELGPLDVGGRRHRVLRIFLLPQGPGELVVETAHLTYLVDEGLAGRGTQPAGEGEAVEVAPTVREQILRPAFRLQLAMRLDPSRVFVGRSRHRDRLDRLLTSVALPGEQAASRVVLLAGRAGMGKSRLVEEVKTRARLGGYRVADVRLAEPGTSLSSGLMRGLFVSLFALAPLVERIEPLGMDEVERHLEQLGLSLPPVLLRGLYAFVQGVRPTSREGPSAGPAPTVADPTSLLTDALRHLSRLGPVLLTIDDLHHATPSERRMVSRLLAGTLDCRVLAILTYREENLRDISELLEHLKTDTGASGLRLGALNYEACRALIAENFAGAEFPDWLVAAIHKRSRGVPLYEVEALRCLVHRGCVRFDAAEGWKADEDAAAALLAELPGTANGLIARQLAWLRAEDPVGFRLLRDIAVLGQDATDEVLRVMHPMERVVFEESIHGLVARGFLKSPASAAGNLEFAHPLKKEAALPNSLEQLERHREAAYALAERSPDSRAGSVAAHLLAAEHRGEAFVWFVRQARYGLEQGAHQEALLAFEEALHLYDDPQVLDHRGDVDRLDLVRPLLGLLMERGSAQRSLQIAEEMHDLAGERGDRLAESEATVSRARSLSRLGRDLEALQAFYAAIDFAEEAGLGSVAVKASLELSQHYRARDREEPARRVLRSAVERFLQLPAEQQREVDAVSLTAALARLDCTSEAEAVWQSVFADAGPGLPTLRAQRARSFLVAYAEGEDAVCQFLEKAMAEGTEGHQALARPTRSLSFERLLPGVPDEEAAAWFGVYSRALQLVGDGVRALEALDASWARRGQQAGLRHRASYLEERIELLAILERGREAAAHAAEFVQLARTLDEPDMLCTALLQAAYLYLSAGDLEAAVPLLEEGLTTARERSMPSLLCRAQLLMAGLDMARKQLDKAYAWCRQGSRLAQDHGLSAELITSAATDMARCRAAMGEVAQAADDCASQAVRLRTQGQPSLAVRCLRMQAGFLMELGQLDGARAALLEAVSLPTTRPGSIREREHAYRDLCEVELLRGDLQGAVEALDKSIPGHLAGLESTSQAPHAMVPSSALEHLTSLCERLHMLGRGEVAHELVSRTLQSLGEEDVVREAQMLLTRARIEALEGDTETARAALVKVLKRLGTARTARGAQLDPAEEERARVRVRVWLELGRMDAMDGELELARKNLQRAWREARKREDWDSVAIALAVLGRVLEEQGEVSKARESWQSILHMAMVPTTARLEACLGLARLDAVEGAQDLALSHVRGAEQAAMEAGWMGVSMLIQVAEAWEMLGVPEQGLPLVERAISIVRLSGVEDRSRLPALLQTLARLHCEREPAEFREALALAEEAVETCRQMGDARALAENLEGLAHILALSGEEGKALEQLEAALKLFDRPGGEAGAGRVHGHLARLQLQAGRVEKARTHLEEALRLGHRVRESSPEVLAEALLTMASLEHEQGHAAEAAGHLLAYLDLALASADAGACMVALHGLEDQPQGFDLARVSMAQWTSLAELLESTPPGEEVVECRLSGVKGLELQRRLAERDTWLDQALDAARRCSPNVVDPATLDELARALERRGDILEAANVYRALASRTELDEETGDLAELRTYACGRAGELMAALGLADEALALYYEAERHAERTKQPPKESGIAWNAFALGALHFDEGRPDEARTWFAKAATRWSSLLDKGTLEPEEHFQAMGMLCISQAHAGAEGEALATLERFRGRVEQDARPYLATWLASACDLAEVLVRLERSAAAHYVLQEALPYLAILNSPELTCRTYTMLSWVSTERKDFEAARAWSQKAVERVPQVLDDTVALQTWVQASMLHTWLREAGPAAQAQAQVIRLAGSLGDWRLGLEQREALVVSLASLGDLEGARVALGNLDAARAEVVALQPEVRIPRPHFAHAIVALRDNQPAQAIELLREDLALLADFAEDGVSGQALFLMSWLGTAYHQDGRWMEAADAFLQCVTGFGLVAHEPLKAGERSFDDASLSTVFLELAEVFARLERWEEAEAALDKARERSSLDPWVACRIEPFAEALRARQVPPHADPLQA